MPEPQPSPEAQVIAIRAALIDTYGEDYAGEDAAAEVERLFRHLGEHEADVQRILQRKNGALERAQAQVAALQREVAFWEAGEYQAELVTARAERDAAVAAVRTAQITHIRDTHPDRMHHPDCGGCWVFLGLSRDLPSRPDDPEEIRRLAQATTEETTNDG